MNKITAKQTKPQTRFYLVDQIRGFAVFLMIFFHLFYDLDMFNIVKNDFFHNPFWYALPRVIVALFLGTVGVSTVLAHPEKINKKKIINRFLKISVLAAIISLVTYYLYPTKWIYFGTLHCIALCTLCALPFRKFPKLSLALGIALFIPEIFFNYQLPWFIMKHAAMDYIPFLPWFGATLIGIFIYSTKFHKLQTANYRFLAPLTFLGSHALIIYLIHQPILMALTWTITFLVK